MSQSPLSITLETSHTNKASQTSSFPSLHIHSEISVERIILDTNLKMKESQVMSRARMKTGSLLEPLT